MPQLTININNRDYKISCQQEEQENITKAAEEVDKLIKSIKKDFPTASLELSYIIALLMQQNQMNSYQHTKQEGQSDEYEKALNFLAEDLQNLVDPQKQ